MTRLELCALRTQCLAIAILLVLGAIAANVMGWKRAFFDGLVQETYAADLPWSVRSVIDDGATVPLDGLSTEERLRVYEFWISQQDPGLALLPARLFASDPVLLLARAERTLVRGNAAQKLRAVEFLGLTGSEQACSILAHARRVADRRRDSQLVSRIDRALRLVSRHAE